MAAPADDDAAGSGRGDAVLNVDQQQSDDKDSKQLSHLHSTQPQLQ